MKSAAPEVPKFDPLGTEIVFTDLRHSYEELIHSRRVPAHFRRAFDSYLVRSQQLTETMRQEYPRFTGLRWEAGSFTGWNHATRVLKALRNLTLHGIPLVLHNTTLSVYPALAFAWDRDSPIGPRQTKAGIRLMRGISFVDSPFSTSTATPGLGIQPTEGQGWIFPLKEFVSYEIQWHLMDGTTHHALDAFGSWDAVRLTLVSFPTLRNYFAYYSESLAAHRKI